MDWLPELFNYGVPTGVLAVLIAGVWRIVRYVERRLLGPDDGIVTAWADESRKTQTQLRQYLQTQEERLDRHTKTCEQHAEAMAQTSHCVTNIQHAALEGCRMCRTWAAAFPEQRQELCEHVEQIERLIRGQR